MMQEARQLAASAGLYTFQIEQKPATFFGRNLEEAQRIALSYASWKGAEFADTRPKAYRAL